MGTLPLFLGGGLLAAGVVLYVLLPIIRGQKALLHRTDDEETEAQFRRRLALSALRDVEYDFATGKLDDEDYRTLKGELSVEALRILEADREPAAESGPPTSGSGPGEEPLGGGTSPADEGGGAGSDDPLEREIERIRRGLEEGLTCRSCARVNPPESRYCGRCGEVLGRRDSRPVSAGEAP